MTFINDRKAVKILVSIVHEGRNELLDEFKYFLKSSPFLGSEKIKRHKLALALDIIITNIFASLADGQERSLTIEEYYQLSFGNRGVNKDSVNTEMSQLLRALYKFLALKEFSKTELAHPPFLAKELSRIRNESGWEKLFTELDKKYFSKSYPNAEILQARHEALYMLLPLFWKSSKRNRAQIWEELNESLDLFYLQRKLEIANGTYISNYKFKEKAEIQEIKHITESIIGKKSIQEMPILFQGHFHSLMLFLSESKEYHYGELKSIVISFNFDLNYPGSEDYLGFLYSLINYCMLKMDEGDEAIPIEANKIFDLGISSGLLHPNGIILYEHLKSIISTKCRIGKIEEATLIFEKFKSKISNDPDTSKMNIIHGILLYYQSRFQEAVSLLRKAGQSQMLLKKYRFDQKLFEIMCRIELLNVEGIDGIEQAMDSFERLIKRNNDLGYSKTYLLLIRILKDLFKAIIQPPIRRNDRFKKISQKLDKSKNPYKHLISAKITSFGKLM